MLKKRPVAGTGGGRKTVPKRVRMDIFPEARSLGGFLASVPHHLGVDHRYASGCLETAIRLACAVIRASVHARPRVSIGRYVRVLAGWSRVTGLELLVVGSGVGAAVSHGDFGSCLGPDLGGI